MIAPLAQRLRYCFQSFAFASTGVYGELAAPFSGSIPYLWCKSAITVSRSRPKNAHQRRPNAPWMAWGPFWWCQSHNGIAVRSGAFWLVPWSPAWCAVMRPWHGEISKRPVASSRASNATHSCVCSQARYGLSFPVFFFVALLIIIVAAAPGTDPQPKGITRPRGISPRRTFQVKPPAGRIPPRDCSLDRVAMSSRALGLATCSKLTQLLPHLPPEYTLTLPEWAQFTRLKLRLQLGPRKHSAL